MRQLQRFIAQIWAEGMPGSLLNSTWRVLSVL